MRNWKTRKVRGHTYLPELLGPNPVILDLGANHGRFTAAMVEIGAVVTAVEANPALIPDVKAAGAAHVIHAAATATPGRVVLRVAENDEASSLLISEGLAVEVEGRTLSSILDEMPSRVDLGKFDIEGAETEVLLNTSDEDLARFAQLCIEFHDAQGITSNDQLKEVNAKLKTCGFRRARFSLIDHSDMLYVNRALVSPQAWVLICLGILRDFLARRYTRFGRRLRSLTRFPGHRC